MFLQIFGTYNGFQNCVLRKLQLLRKFKLKEIL